MTEAFVNLYSLSILLNNTCIQGSDTRDAPIVSGLTVTLIVVYVINSHHMIQYTAVSQEGRRD